MAIMQRGVNWHGIQLQDSKKYDDWRSTKGGYLFGENIKIPENVTVIWGCPKGTSKPYWIAQAIQFPTNYSIEAVRKWAKKNLKEWVAIVPAKKDKIAASVQIVKRLAVYPETIKPMAVMEAFFSLRDALEKAVSYKFGKDAFVHDFSEKEVIIGYDKSETRPMSSYESKEYEKINYKMDSKGVIDFSGVVTLVSKTVSFENASSLVWKSLWEMEHKLRTKVEEMAKIRHISRRVQGK